MKILPSAESAATRWYRAVRAPMAILLSTGAVWTVACTDGPVELEDLEDTETLETEAPRVTLSDPFAPVAAGPAAVTGLDVTYVSLPPGSLASGSSVEVRNEANGVGELIPVFGGGFDPVAIPAISGDTLRFRAFDGWVDDGEAGGSNVIAEWEEVVPLRRPPVVVRTYPPKGKRDIPVALSVLVVFSEPVDTAGLRQGGIQLSLDGSPVQGVVGVAADGLNAAFAPDAPLLPSREYVLTIATAVRDLDGDALATEEQVRFSTGDPSARLVLAPADDCSEHPATAVVTFADANLDAAVRTALGVRPQDDITCEQAAELTSLTYSADPYMEVPPPPTTLTSLAGIQNLTGLTRLVLPNHALTDIGPLAALTELDSLNLTTNWGGPGAPPTISDLEPLRGLTNLTYLNLNTTGGVRDVDPLRGLTGLAVLYIRFNSIVDVSPLGGLTSLRRLNLAGNAIVDVSPLSALTGLTWLAINQNAIADIGPLAGLTNVAGTLWLMQNRITDLSALRGMTGVTTLIALGNEITNIGGLESLGNLRSVGLRDNPNLADIEPLLDNPRVVRGDTIHIDLTNTSVSCEDIARLQARGVGVAHTCGVTPVVISAPSLPGGTAGVAYSAVLTAMGGDGVYTWSGGSLPIGLTVNPAGMVSGTPMNAGRIALMTTVRSGPVSATRTFSITVSSP